METADSTFDLTAAVITMDWNPIGEDTAAQSFAIGTGITLTDPANGEFTIGGVIVTAAAGVYNYDIQFVTATYGTQTWIKGVVTVERDET